MSHLEKISTSVVAITSGWGHGNVGGIALDNFVVVVDTTNSPERGKEFRNKLDERFDVPVKYTFLTHHHSDHATGLNAFSDTTVISHKQTAKKIRSLTRINTYPSVVFDTDYMIRDQDSLVELYHTGGHTSDSSYLHFPHDRVIFAGDLIMEGFLPFAGYQSNPHNWINAFNQIKKLRPKLIVPGHGPVLRSVGALDKHITLISNMIDILQTASKERMDPRTTEIPKFVYNASTCVSDEELEKWFRRTAISWIRRV
ncbi:MAG: MBL fold metallo-hydrolase [Candidatus Thorarchaeota archaeon]